MGLIRNWSVYNSKNSTAVNNKRSGVLGRLMLYLVLHMITVKLSPLYDDLRCNLVIEFTIIWNLNYAQQELGDCVVVCGLSF